jgi:hypothetical protein
LFTVHFRFYFDFAFSYSDFPLLQVFQEIQYFIFRYRRLKILPTRNISLCEPKDTVTYVRVPKEMEEKREEWKIGGGEEEGE